MNWTAFADLVKGFIPGIIAALVPGFGIVLGPLVADGINIAEQELGHGTGPAKRAAVLSTVADAIAVLNVKKGAAVLDPVTVSAQVGSAIDLGIGFINDIQKAQAVVPPVVPVVAPVVPVVPPAA